MNTQQSTVAERFNSKFPQKLIRKSINWGMESDPKRDIIDFIESEINLAEQKVREEILNSDEYKQLVEQAWMYRDLTK